MLRGVTQCYVPGSTGLTNFLGQVRSRSGVDLGSNYVEKQTFSNVGRPAGPGSGSQVAQGIWDALWGALTGTPYTGALSGTPYTGDAVLDALFKIDHFKKVGPGQQVPQGGVGWVLK